jgi:hypothetical protein
MPPRFRLLPPSVVFMVAVGAACAGPPQSQAAAERRDGRGPRARLDSAAAARLCANPDQVRAGLAACELRDQAVPPRTMPRTPPR